MKRIINHNINSILWGVAVVGGAIIFLLLFNLTVQTSRLSLKTDNTVKQLQRDLKSVEADIERDHRRQDAVLACIAGQFIDNPTITQDAVEGCRRVTETGVGIAPEDRSSGDESARVVYPSSSTQPKRYCINDSSMIV